MKLQSIVGTTVLYHPDIFYFQNIVISEILNFRNKIQILKLTVCLQRINNSCLNTIFLGKLENKLTEATTSLFRILRLTFYRKTLNSSIIMEIFIHVETWYTDKLSNHLFIFFCLRFYVSVNSYGYVETVSSPNHTFF